MKKIFIALSLVLAAVSCNKADINEEKGTGALKMSMSIEAQTKAGMSDDDRLNTASVKIYKANFKGLVREYTYSDMPSPLYLAADAYRVDVLAGEIVKENPALASWEQKSYKGSQEFTIRPNQLTDVKVEAFVNNAVTCITFDPTIVENFKEGYKFTVGLGEDAMLVYDSSKDGAEGYFIVECVKNPSLEWTFTGLLEKDGSEFIKTGNIENVAAGRLYKMNLRYTVKDGDIVLSLMVDYTTEDFDDTIVFEPVRTGLVGSKVWEIWAAHADVHASVDQEEYSGASVQFAYKSNNSDWNYVDGVAGSEGAFDARLTGLTASTDYTYNLVINGEFVGDPRTFTTEPAPQLPNASFEYVSKVVINGSEKNWYQFYDPNCGVEGATTKFWGSGNGDAESKGTLPGTMSQITVPDNTTYYTGDGGKQSVLAQSQKIEIAIIKKLAAGNLFTGRYAETVGTEGGKVNFGRPISCRPTAIRFWAKYTTGNMDFTGTADGQTFTTSDIDRAQIKIAFGNWDYKKYGGEPDSPVQVNTTDESTFVDFYNDPKGGTLANCDVVIYNDGYNMNRAGKVTDAVGEWKEYVIPIMYKDEKTLAGDISHIIISCSASQYGDYFVGSSSSKLWLDAFELIYE